MSIEMNKVKYRKYKWAAIFLLPSMIGLGLFRLYPIIKGLIRSFYSSSLQGGEFQSQFVGLQNYINLFHDSFFLNSLKVTLKFNVIITPIQIFLALLLALLLTRNKLGVSVFRALYLIPLGIALPIASVIWRIILLPSGGLVNGFLTQMGLNPQPFFTGASQALWSIVLVATWKGAAYWMIFLVAGLKDIPNSLYESAEVDGANLFQKIIHISLPLLKPTILFVLVVDTITNFLLFSPMYVITKGGPMGSTDVLMFEAYRSGFVYGNMGRSMAIVMIIFVIVLAIVGLEFRMLRSEG